MKLDIMRMGVKSSDLIINNEVDTDNAEKPTDNVETEPKEQDR